MKPTDLMIKVYGECKEGQWTLVCLDFSLAVQSDDLLDAEKKMSEQIHQYLLDATSGPDVPHAEALLRRRAPLVWWLKFYWHMGRAWGHHAKRNRIAESQPLPLVPAHA